MASIFQNDTTVAVVPLMLDPLGKLITENVTLAKVAVAPVDYLAGRLMGKITADGKIVEYDPAALDGSQNVYAILGNDVTVGIVVDATGSFVYLKGMFNQNRITAKAGVVIADVKDALRDLGIYLKDVAVEV